MFRSMLASVLLVVLSFAASARDKPHDENVEILFFSPAMDSDVSAIRESSFSVPKPIVILDPIVLGDPDEHPDTTAIHQIDSGRVKVRVRGVVYDLVADIAAGGEANIRQVAIESTALGTIAIVPVVAVEAEAWADSAPHPLEWELGELANAVRAYPFAGRFESEVFMLPISTGSNDIYVHATNVVKGLGVSGIDISATVDRGSTSYSLEVEMDNQIDLGLVNPILVSIEDATVNSGNVDSMEATINGATVGLRFVDGQLQLDRPIMGVNRTPPSTIPNLVSVVGDPDEFIIRYKGIEAVFGWSYTR